MHYKDLALTLGQEKFKDDGCLFKSLENVKVQVKIDEFEQDGAVVEEDGEEPRGRLRMLGGVRNDFVSVVATSEGLFLDGLGATQNKAFGGVFVPYQVIVLHSVGGTQVYFQAEITYYKPSPADERIPIVSSLDDRDEPLLIEFHFEFPGASTAREFYQTLSDGACYDSANSDEEDR